MQLSCTAHFQNEGGSSQQEQQGQTRRGPQILALVHPISSVDLETLPLLLVQHIKLRTSVAVEQSCHVSTAQQCKLGEQVEGHTHLLTFTAVTKFLS